MRCRDLGLSRMRCESDCAQLIKALTFDQSSAEFYGIVPDIKPRESNKEADEMAKKNVIF